MCKYEWMFECMSVNVHENIHICVNVNKVEFMCINVFEHLSEWMNVKQKRNYRCVNV